MPDVAVCIVHLSDVFSSSQSLWGSAFCNMSLIACYWLLLTVSLFVVCVSCFCFVFSFMLNNICLLKCLISLCSSWTDRETNYVLPFMPFVVFIVYCLFVSRLRYRPPSEFSSDIQCLRVHQQVQIRWLHGPAARQVVQSGSVWEPCVRRYWGQCDSSTPVWPWPPVPFMKCILFQPSQSQQNNTRRRLDTSDLDWIFFLTVLRWADAVPCWSLWDTAIKSHKGRLKNITQTAVGNRKPVSNTARNQLLTHCRHRGQGKYIFLLLKQAACWP